MGQRIGLLVAVAIGLVAAQPLLSGQLPRGDDALLHLYRLVQLDHLVANGVLFSRWAPDLAFGYGVPLFNFYAPLLYYLAELPHLAGLGLVQSLTLTLAFTVIAGSAGMYLWVSDWLGWRAGLVSAMAYSAAPYTMFNLLHRGAFAEHLALSLAPLALWCLHRWLTRGALRYSIAFTVCYAALLLSHNISALVFTPILAAYPLFVYALSRGRPSVSPIHRATVVQSWLMLATGLGLTAFFWLPAFIERDLVQIEKTYVPAVFDYRFNFIELGEILAPPTPVEAGLVSFPVTRSLNLVALALSGIGLIGLRLTRFTRAQKGLIVVALAGLVASALMTLDVSRPIWDAIPLLRFIQFPWRFLGLASLFTAILAGAGFAVLAGRWERASITHVAALPVTLAILAVYVFTWQFVPHHPTSLGASINDIAPFERQWSAPGLSAGEYLPVAVKEWPATNAVTEFDPSAVPEGVDASQFACGLLSCDISLDAAGPVTVPLNIFNFAGWQATLDGQPQSLVTLEPHGLIGILVPTGQHQLRLTFGSTPIRDLAIALSAVTALAALMRLVAVVVGWRRRQPAVNVATAASLTVAPHRLGEAVAVCGLLALILASKSVLDGVESPLRASRFDGQAVSNLAFPLNVNFGNELALMGIDAAPDAESAGAWTSTLYWRAMQPLDKDYHVAVQIMDKTGVMIGQSNSEYPGGVATSLWPDGAYAKDQQVTPVKPGTPPGEYQIQVVVYEQGRPENRLFVMDEHGVPVGATFDATSAKVMILQVTRPSGPVSVDAVTPDVKLDGVRSDNLRLLGYDRLPERLNAGDAFRFTLYWQATDAIIGNPTVRFRLSQGGAEEAGFDMPPVESYPVAEWQPGDVWRAQHVVRIPPGAKGGRLSAEVVIGEDGIRAPLGAIEVAAPEHLFARPQIKSEQAARFGDIALLAGYDAPARLEPGQPFTVTLYWQAAGETTTRYKVFVHLVDAGGNRLAGDDATPSAGSRPTSGWVKGEYIADAHTLRLPDDAAGGDYRILVGLYDETSLQRLATAEGADSEVLSNRVSVSR